MAVAEAVDTVMFIARGRNYRAVRQARVVMPHPVTGGHVVQNDGVTYDFSPNGTLEVEPGQDVLPTGPRGALEDAVTWLSRHADLNIYFWRDGYEPEKPLPTEEVLLERITDAAMGGQPHVLRGILDRELGTYRRPIVTNVAETALRRLLRPLGGEMPDEELEERLEREALEAGWEAELAEAQVWQSRGGSIEDRRAADAAAKRAAELAGTLAPEDDLVR